MSTLFIYPYSNASNGLSEITNVCKGQVRRIRRTGSRFVGSPAKTVVNWGCTGITNLEVGKCRILNKPAAVSIASNKLSFFNHMAEKCKALGDDNITPEFTEDKQQVLAWLHSGKTVFARTLLNSHSGEGIEEITADKEAIVDDIPDAPLYVLYVPKKHEYRVHILGPSHVDVQEKLRSMDTPLDEVNWRVRSHQNGFVYGREKAHVNNACIALAKKAVGLCGLDFGAVDIIYNERRNRYYVLEVNTAPGAVGTTAENYAKYFDSIPR